jgi:hypothetical protein
LRAKRHQAFSAWIEAIKNTTITHLNQFDEWKDDNGLIQVKTMSVYDLDYNPSVPKPRSERHYGHESDDYLYVIKMPMALPVEEENPASNFFSFVPMTQVFSSAVKPLVGAR